MRRLARRRWLLAVLCAAGAAHADPADTLSYVGTGDAGLVLTSSGITGMDVLLVLVRCGDPPVGPAVIATYGLPLGASKSVTGGGWIDGGIISMDRGSFTLGLAPEVNALGVTCHALVLTWDMQAAWGSYQGDGQTSRKLSFPDSEYAIVVPSDDAPTGHLMSAFGQTTELGSGWLTGGLANVGGSLVVSGPFNRTGVEYAVAVFTNRTQVLTGTFPGNGLPSTRIDLGGQPAAVFAEVGTGASPTVWRPASVAGNRTLTLSTDAGAFPDGILRLHVNGFDVGMDPRVNTPPMSTHYVAFVQGIGPFDAGILPDGGTGGGQGGGAGGAGGGQGGGAGCPLGTTDCGGAGCVDLATNQGNCGSCGFACGLGLACVGGSCGVGGGAGGGSGGGGGASGGGGGAPIPRRYLLGCACDAVPALWLLAALPLTTLRRRAR